MSEIKIILEIPGLVDAINGLADAVKCRPATPVATVVEEINPIPEITPKPAVTQMPDPAAAVAAVPEQPPKPVKPTYTLEELSRAGGALIDQGKMQPLLNLLAKFGVKAITQLDPSTYGDLAEGLKALGAPL